MKKVRTKDDGTIVSYEIDVNGVIITRHMKHMSKIKNVGDETDVAGEGKRAGAESQVGFQQ